MCSRRRSALIVALLLNSAVLFLGVPAAHAQGPLVLMGIDAEDGGPGGHGPVSVYGDVVEFVYNEAFGGTGILVIGGGKGGDPSNPCGASFDNVTAFWDAVSADTGIPVTYVFGPAIATVDFSPFRMIAVVSDQFNTPCGGLTLAEHTTLSARQSDIATYVNSGRGLIGFSSDFGAAAYSYLSGVGTFVTLTNQSYLDITPTPAGAAIGITNALDVCCWHDIFQVFPSFLEVLATVTPTTQVAAIGGAQVEIPVGITLTPAHDENPAIPGKTHTVTATVEDQDGTPQAGVSVRFEVISGPNAGFNSTTTPTCAPGPSPMCLTDANGQVSWTYPNTTATGGTDTIEACFTDAQGVEKCARATKEWVAPASIVGRMTGGGKIGGSTVTHGFHLMCDQFRGPQRLQVTWDGNRFHLESILTAFCSNDPAIDEEEPPSGFDTYDGTGNGRCNNLPAFVSWKFTDAGEPGDEDTATITITGGCSLSISGKLTRGNHQAHPQ